MATPVSHMDDLDMVHIRRKNEKGKKIKKEKWGRGGERERYREARMSCPVSPSSGP